MNRTIAFFLPFLSKSIHRRQRNKSIFHHVGSRVSRVFQGPGRGQAVDQEAQQRRPFAPLRYAMISPSLWKELELAGKKDDGGFLLRCEKKRRNAQRCKWGPSANSFTSSIALFKIGKGFEFKKSDEPSRFSFEVRCAQTGILLFPIFCHSSDLILTL